MKRQYIKDIGLRGLEALIKGGKPVTVILSTPVQDMPDMQITIASVTGPNRDYPRNKKGLGNLIAVATTAAEAEHPLYTNQYVSVVP